jgi:hypothetical protein
MFTLQAYPRPPDIATRGAGRHRTPLDTLISLASTEHHAAVIGHPTVARIMLAKITDGGLRKNAQTCHDGEFVSAVTACRIYAMPSPLKARGQGVYLSSNELTSN